MISWILAFVFLTIPMSLNGYASNSYRLYLCCFGFKLCLMMVSSLVTLFSWTLAAKKNNGEYFFGKSVVVKLTEWLSSLMQSWGSHLYRQKEIMIIEQSFWFLHESDPRPSRTLSTTKIKQYKVADATNQPLDFRYLWLNKSLYYLFGGQEM